MPAVDVTAANVNAVKNEAAESGGAFEAAESSEPLNLAAAGSPAKKESPPLVRLVALACVNSGYLAFQIWLQP